MISLLIYNLYCIFEFMVKSVTRGFLLFFVILVVGGLKAQALVNGLMKHRVLTSSNADIQGK